MSKSLRPSWDYGRHHTLPSARVGRVSCSWYINRLRQCRGHYLCNELYLSGDARTFLSSGSTVLLLDCISPLSGWDGHQCCGWAFVLTIQLHQQSAYSQPQLSGGLVYVVHIAAWWALSTRGELNFQYILARPSTLNGSTVSLTNIFYCSGDKSTSNILTVT